MGKLLLGGGAVAINGTVSSKEAPASSARAFMVDSTGSSSSIFTFDVLCWKVRSFLGVISLVA